jgi:hypothetical protein
MPRIVSRRVDKEQIKRRSLSASAVQRRAILSVAVLFLSPISLIAYPRSYCNVRIRNCY